MKNRYFTGTLILLVWLTCGILIKADSQRQTPTHKYKVGTMVVSENHRINSLMENHLKQELRKIDDVEVVDGDRLNPQWDLLISIQVLEIKHRSGASTGLAAICLRFYNRIPTSYFKDKWQSKYEDLAAVHLPTGNVAYHPISDLDTYCKESVVDFEQKYLVGMRYLKERRR